MTGKLSHFDEAGQAHMVDVGDKAITHRMAVARCFVTMGDDTLELVRQGSAKKGDVIGTARLAGIMAAKKTADLIPLCHTIPIQSVSLDFALELGGVAISATVKGEGKTGYEMEAMTAVSVAALTLYDMLKSSDKGMIISDIRLVLKDGGKSGRFEAP